MAIEGPLRELGIHDVFQLLDLSRKTGALTVTSSLRDNQGTVLFDRGAVTFAAIRSNPNPLGELLLRAGKISEGDLTRALDAQQRSGERKRLGEILVELGAITQRELERQVRFQVEEVVFELMSWREGFFSFEERELLDAAAEATIRISTESLLMEAARRIDEWSRIEGKIPNLGVVPVLAPVADSHATLLDLRPNEWEVLAQIDGERDLRAIAASLGASEFDVARVAYGLVTTGVVELRNVAPPIDEVSRLAQGAGSHLARARAALRAREGEQAIAAARCALEVDGNAHEARIITARALSRMGRHAEALEELRQLLRLDALNPAAHRELGHCAARRGDHDEAVASWGRYLRLAPDAPDAPRVRAMAEAASTLRTLLQEEPDV
jgi:tetratricopeptide (TPR) repeat protein